MGIYNKVIKERNKNNTPHEEDLPYFRPDGAMPIKACMHGTAADAAHILVYTGLDRHWQLDWIQQIAYSYCGHNMITKNNILAFFISP